MKRPTLKNSVFAVHKWETADGKHHDVSVWNKKGRMTVKQFKDWEDAEIYAQKAARRLGLGSYQVDTPSRPHIIMELKKLRKVS